MKMARWNVSSGWAGSAVSPASVLFQYFPPKPNVSTHPTLTSFVSCPNMKPRKVSSLKKRMSSIRSSVLLILRSFSGNGMHFSSVSSCSKIFDGCSIPSIWLLFLNFVTKLSSCWSVWKSVGLSTYYSLISIISFSVQLSGIDLLFTWGNTLWDQGVAPYSYYMPTHYFCYEPNGEFGDVNKFRLVALTCRCKLRNKTSSFT